MAKRTPRSLVASEEWSLLLKKLDEQAPWKKGLPFLQGITTDDRAAFQGVSQGYQLALDVLNEFASPVRKKQTIPSTYQE